MGVYLTGKKPKGKTAGHWGDYIFHLAHLVISKEKNDIYRGDKH